VPSYSMTSFQVRSAIRGQYPASADLYQAIPSPALIALRTSYREWTGGSFGRRRISGKFLPALPLLLSEPARRLPDPLSRAAFPEVCGSAQLLSRRPPEETRGSTGRPPL